MRISRSSTNNRCQAADSAPHIRAVSIPAVMRALTPAAMMRTADQYLVSSILHTHASMQKLFQQEQAATPCLPMT